MTLNEKIAKWCGFQWQDPFILPHFTESMDAILKWVVPKLCEKQYSFAIKGTPNGYNVGILNVYGSFNDIDNSLPMAFCLALEKYIIEAQESK